MQDKHAVDGRYIGADKYKRPVDLTNVNLYRVFILKQMKLGGRFYGGWWEGISEKDREHILINRYPTVELDYKSIHPYILYGIEGVTPKEKDQYYLSGFDKEANEKIRPLIKLFLLMIFNSGSEAMAINALREKYRKLQQKAKRLGKPIPEPPFKLTKKNIHPVIEQLRKQHAPISHHFFSDCGNMLMNHDSEMAEEVLLHFANKGIACLPVHDSFIIDVRYAEECWDVMREAFQSRFKQDIPIDYQDILTAYQRHRHKQSVLPLSDEWNDMEAEITYDIMVGDPSDDHGDGM